MPFAVEEVGPCRRVGVMVFDFLRNDKTVVFVKGNEVAVERGIVGCGEAQAVFGIEAGRFFSSSAHGLIWLARRMPANEKPCHMEPPMIGFG